MTNHSSKGRGQGHMTHFFNFDVRNHIFGMAEVRVAKFCIWCKGTQSLSVRRLVLDEDSMKPGQCFVSLSAGRQTVHKPQTLCPLSQTVSF